MYVPVGQRGTSGSRGMSPQQSAAMGGQGIAAGIRAADVSLQAKKKEAQRQYENAQAMMRTDLNAIAAFDVTKAGPDKSKALIAMANDISEQIKEMNNPVEARALIAKFRQYYNSGVARENLKAEASLDARSRVGADGKTLDALNSGLPAGMEYDDVDASWLAKADAKWNKEYVYQDGEIYVMDSDGNLVKEDEADFLQDTSMYQVGTHSVDVGSLVEWAQSDATKTAIGFKNGKWDETRARNYYRDNILLDQREGKEHRLQLLTTMEDRGLTAHLTEEEKQQFRDGVGLESEKFSEIIQKGEDEFVERSQFDGVIGGGKNTSGKGGTKAEDDNITVNGLNVPSRDTGTLLKDLQYQDRAGHSINRFNKMPSLQGAFEVPGKPNTDKLDIIGAGINSKGQRVAYIRGYEDVVTDTGIPGFEDTDRKKFYKEIVIGGDELGVGSDVYQEIYQNHPKMAELIENQLDAYEENKLKRPKPQTEEDQTSISDVDGQTTAEDLVRSGKEAVERYGKAKDIMSIVDGAPDYMLDDMFRETFGVSYQEMRNQEADASKNPLLKGIGQSFFDEGFSFTGNKNSNMRSLIKAKLGPEMAALMNQYPEVKNEYELNPQRAERARAQREAANADAPETPQEREKRRDEARSDIRQDIADTFLDNPIGRLFGYQGPEQRAEAERRKEEVGGRGKVVQVNPERLGELRDGLSQSNKVKLDAALNRVVEERMDPINGVSARIQDGRIIVTDGRDVPIPGIEPIPLTSNIAETAGDIIFGEEGYSEAGTIVNVPANENSGVTIGGLDLGSKAGDIDRKLEILSSYIPKDQIEELRKISKLTGTEASNALANARNAGRINPESWGLTDDNFREMQTRYLDERVIPDLVSKVSKFSPSVDKEDIEELPPQVIQAITSMEFVTPGEGRESSALTAVGRAIESGKFIDWINAANAYEMYYGTLQQQQDSLDAGRILPGNIKRAQRAAALIRSVYS